MAEMAQIATRSDTRQEDVERMNDSAFFLVATRPLFSPWQHELHEFMFIQIAQLRRTYPSNGGQ